MSGTVNVENRPAKPVFIYDGECRFCLHWVSRWTDLTEARVEFHPSQSPEISSRFPEIPSSDFDRSSQFIDLDGKVYFGAEAVFRMLQYAHGKGWWLWIYDHVRGVKGASEKVYRLIAANRSRISPINRLFFHEKFANHSFVAGVFLRLLGLVYLCAFLSLWPQIHGLFGRNGILPVSELMQAAGQQLSGFARWQQLPSFCWLSSSDSSLSVQCAAGTALSVLLMAGLLPALITPLLWLLWLSVTVAGQDFMAFQWENLLLESGFLAIFLAPVSLGLRSERPSLLAVFLFRWLLFRLMFMSGMVKLLSGDPAWRDFTALSYHFETQPLPTIFGWYAHHLPSWLLAAQTAVMYVIEIGCAFLVFGSRRLRLAALVGFVLLQLGIAVTGNYGYFNLLTIVLCVMLLDDSFFKASPVNVSSLRRWRNSILTMRSVLFGLSAIAILLVSSMQMISGLGLKRAWSRPLIAVYAYIEPFRSVNSYGLFATMTKTRPEIIIQGSDDGETWKNYEFKSKPGDLKRAPRFVAPHQPRLDWQMWFAALGSYERNPWFTNFCRRLLEGDAAVLELLAGNPFPSKPPCYVRAIVADYEFTTTDERKKTGAWWRSKNERIYLPAVSIQRIQK